MKALQVRELTNEEHAALQSGLRAPSAFTVRRCQILLMSAEEGLKAAEIGRRLRCSDQCVRDAIHAFAAEGLRCLQEQSRARHSQQATFDAAGREWLKSVIRQSPRSFGYDSSLWTLDLLAELAHRQGYSERQVNPETVGRALAREGIEWKRAKQRINSPDAHYAGKKSAATG
ncbi:MAG: helix-turn-helix domain-containing protein [Hydrogenophaga sp.]|nr:helix-turn-helix domain-containing protein [Hydrogenophaga sp.]